MIVTRNGNWPTVRSNSFIVVAAIDPKQFLYCKVIDRAGDSVLVEANIAKSRSRIYPVDAKTILFELTKEQYKHAKEKKWPQESEFVMSLVNWGKGGTG